MKNTIKPLTFKELMSVNNEPLYFYSVVGPWKLNGWHIVDVVSYPCSSCEDLKLDNNDNCIFDTYNYGITWFCYREAVE